MVVIGGLGSVPGALLGSFYVRGTQYFLPAEWQFLATGAGLLLVLMIFPGGLGAALYEIRDWYLRRVAARRHLIVASLLADQRVEPEPVPAAALDAAEDAAQRAHVPEALP
jgi:branched-chain amino acid transport system permease protein